VTKIAEEAGLSREGAHDLSHLLTLPQGADAADLSSEDPVFPIDHARRDAEALPNAELIEIDDSHGFTPEAVADALSAFASG
jgi:pimeloyl-ACP methyl ester carboxylesterase